MGRRTAKKEREKRTSTSSRSGRPAGIQAMDWELYVRVQQAVRELACRRQIRAGAEG